MQAVASSLQPKVLLNMMNENGNLSRSHAIPKHILEKQADALNLPLITAPASWTDYESVFSKNLKECIKKYGVNTAVFGDIDLQAHLDWEEKVCKTVGIKAELPLWQRNRKTLVAEILQQPVEAYIVSCNELMGESFLGRKMDEQLIHELEEIGVDPCGENGEYHTLVVNCPLFSGAVKVDFGSKHHHANYWFIEIN
jgi:uncharacterized protein (TIGR00290 family)